jgi:hypothetical protein
MARASLLLLITLTLTACTAIRADPAPAVAPPLVVTVVVTPTGGKGASTPAATPGTATPAPLPTSSYPTPIQARLTCVYQPFERGFMIYLPDRKAVWVFYSPFSLAATPAPDVGRWLPYADTFVEGEPETDPNLVPPEGFQQPKRGFGKVWRNSPIVRDALGWGLQFELPYEAVVTDYAIGAFDASGAFTAQSFFHTITDFNGKLIRIDEATGTWSKQ